MAKKNPNLSREELNEISKQISDINREMSRSFTSFYQGLSNVADLYKENNRLAEISQEIIEDIEKTKRDITEEEKVILEYYQRQNRVVKGINEQLSTQQLLITGVKAGMNSLYESSLNFLDSLQLFNYLAEVDTAVKELNIDLGLSAQRADAVRDSMFEAAKETRALGVYVTDLVKIQSSYAEEAGTIAGLTRQSQIAVAEIAAGTALSEEGAGQLAGQFFKVGKNVETVGTYIEDIVNSSEAMGINSANVLKRISDNFRKINEFRFERGVEGIAEMAKHAERFKIDLDGSFQTLERARTLEGAIDMAAQLQVMGGQFAAGADPFGLMYMARNNPEDFVKHLNNMTSSLATFNKETGDFQISALDMDRLRIVAQATGQDMASLAEQAKELSRTQFVGERLLGFTEDDKNLVAQFATISKNGRVTIDVGGEQVDISSITESHLAMLKGENESLGERAKLNQSFDKQFQNAVMELKALALPLIESLNDLLKWIRETGDQFGGMTGTIFKVAAMGGILGLGKGGLNQLGGLVGNLLSGLGKVPSLIRGARGVGGGATIAGGAGSLSNIGNAAGKSSGQIGSMSTNVKGLGQAAGGASRGLMSFGLAMLEIGGAIALAGAGIGLATAGIGFMFEKAALLDGTDVGSQLLDIGAGIGMIAISAPIAMASMIPLSLALWGLSNINLSNLSEGFHDMNEFLKSDFSKLDKLKDTLAVISDMEASKLDKLANVLDKGLKVKFDENSKAQFDIEVVNNIDGDKFVNKFSKKINLKLINAKKGNTNV